MTQVGGLTDFELDALAELVNIGVNRAAAKLREMVREQVHLSVPIVRLVGRTEAVGILRERAPTTRLLTVHQGFEGDISGQALLIFPEAKSLELVRAVAGHDLPPASIIELEEEVLVETGNIILHGCLGTIANLLHRSLQMSLPAIVRGQAAEVLEGQGDVVMLLYVDFGVRERDVQGYVSLLMDPHSLTALIFPRKSGRG